MRPVNRGEHAIHCGGRFDAPHLVPLAQGAIGALP
jgi:hypothetical protein